MYIPCIKSEREIRETATGRSDLEGNSRRIRGEQKEGETLIYFVNASTPGLVVIRYANTGSILTRFIHNLLSHL